MSKFYNETIKKRMIKRGYPLCIPYTKIPKNKKTTGYHCTVCIKYYKKGI